MLIALTPLDEESNLEICIIFLFSIELLFFDNLTHIHLRCVLVCM
jgi:hypothetical protein